MRSHSPSRMTLVLLAVLWFAGACGDDPAGPRPVTSVSVDPASAELAAIGQTVQFSATARRANGDAVPDATFTWESLDPQVLTVDDAGMATAVAAGSGRVRVRVAGSEASDEAAVTITQQVSTLTLVTAPDSVLVGGSAQAAAAAADANGFAVPDPAVTWSTSDPAILEVDPDGSVRGVGRGTAELTARAGTVTAAATVRVLLPNLPVTRDTTVSGTVALRSLNVAPGVTVAFDGPVLLDIEEGAEIEGSLVADCTAIEVLAGGAVRITGAIRNSCSDSLAVARGDLVIAGNGGIVIDSAQIASSGAIAITNDLTLTADDFDPVPDIGAEDEDDEGGMQARTRDIDALFAGVRRQWTLRSHAGIGAGAVVQAVDCILNKTFWISGTSGVHATGEEAGGNAPVTVIRCADHAKLREVRIHGGAGGRGGTVHRFGTAPVAVAAEGGRGGDLLVHVTGQLEFTGALIGGTGGMGGNAGAEAMPDPGSRAPSAEARGGRGGIGGIVDVQASEVVGGGQRLDGRGGEGGYAAALGADGKAEYAIGAQSQAGGNARATGGRGGASLNAGGEGGQAVSRAGNGAPGSAAAPDGGAGGIGFARGGRGGRGSSTPAGPAQRRGTGGTGGTAGFYDGNGGDGFDRCVSGSEGPGGAGGIGGAVTGGPGAGGPGARNDGGPGTVVAENLSNGGAGGDGLPAGNGGAAGANEVGQMDIVTDPIFQPGADGARCPGAEPKVSLLIPARVPAGGGDFELAVAGEFGPPTPETRVFFGGHRLTVIGMERAEIRVTVTAELIRDGGTFPVIVEAPDGRSPPADFFVDNPVPEVHELLPFSFIAGAPMPAVEVKGSGFVPSSVVRIGDVMVPSEFASPTSLSVTPLAELAATAGELEILVFNPAPGGGTSPPFTFFVNNPPPVITGVTPGDVLTGSGPVDLQIAGTGFVPGSTVLFGDDELTTQFGGATSLTATLPGDLIGAPGDRDIFVFNPAPGGGMSDPFAFRVLPPQPTTSILLTPGSLTAAHTVGVTACPQQISGFALRNTGQTTVMFSAGIGGPMSVTPASGSLAPGGERALTLFFDCSAPQPVQTMLDVTATPTDGGPPVSASAPFMLEMFRQGVTLKRQTGPFAAGSVIYLSSIDGGHVNGPDNGCTTEHYHAPGYGIYIDGLGPYADPEPSGCGFGPVAPAKIE